MLICASFLVAYLIVVGGEGTAVQRSVFLGALPVVLGMRYVCFVAFRIYRRVWRYATARDALAIAVAVGISEVLAFLVIVATRPLGDFPARVFLVDAVLCTALVTASRLALRLLPDLAGLAQPRRRGGAIVVVGAGRAGRSLVRELREDADGAGRRLRRRQPGAPRAADPGRHRGRRTVRDRARCSRRRAPTRCSSRSRTRRRSASTRSCARAQPRRYPAASCTAARDDGDAAPGPAAES